MEAGSTNTTCPVHVIDSFCSTGLSKIHLFHQIGSYFVAVVLLILPLPYVVFDVVFNVDVIAAVVMLWGGGGIGSCLYDK